MIQIHHQSKRFIISAIIAVIVASVVTSVGLDNASMVTSVKANSKADEIAEIQKSQPERLDRLEKRINI